MRYNDIFMFLRKMQGTLNTSISDFHKRCRQELMVSL